MTPAASPAAPGCPISAYRCGGRWSWGQREFALDGCRCRYKIELQAGRRSPRAHNPRMPGSTPGPEIAIAPHAQEWRKRHTRAFEITRPFSAPQGRTEICGFKSHLQAWGYDRDLASDRRRTGSSRPRPDGPSLSGTHERPGRPARDGRAFGVALGSASKATLKSSGDSAGTALGPAPPLPTRTRTARGAPAGTRHPPSA